MRSKPFQLPEGEFSQEEESEFRRELTNRLEDMSIEDDSIASAVDTSASSMIKRQLLSAPALGQSEVDENFQVLGLKDATGYMSASKAVSSYSVTGYTRNADQWVAAPTSWTSNIANGWSESSGAFSYSGEMPDIGSRKFLVSYAFSLYGYSTQAFWRMIGKLTKTPSGGSAADIAGSMQTDSYYGSQIAFGVYFMLHNVSASTIVSIASGDTISFQYGHYVSHAIAGTYNIGNLQSLSGMDGIGLAISPID